ncbi:MAG: AAA family ATPase [Magnetococcales bacterium]|nr:AAA family ATPase [Magnetococcales bacterium]
MQNQPFVLTPDIERFFSGAGRGALLTRLGEAIGAGEGFIQVTGAAGTGKSMLCRMLCQQQPERIRVALLIQPNLSPGELIPAILKEFRLSAPGRKEKLAARQTLLNQLLLHHRQGARTLLVIDDAHCLPDATLEELRLLGNLETGQTKLIQVVLFAQPTLETRLREGAASGFSERITTRLVLEPLSGKELDGYLHARLQSAGFQGGELFSPRALRCLHLASRGNLHRIHQLAHQALQNAHAEGSLQVSVRHVNQLSTWLMPLQWFSCWYRPVLATAGLTAMMLGGTVLTTWATGHGVEPPVAATQATPTIPVPAMPQPAAPALPQPMPERLAEEEQPVQVPDEVLVQSNQEAESPAPEAESAKAIPAMTPYLKANDPLREVILDSHRWLEQGNEAHYTIQLMLLGQDQGLHGLISQLKATPAPAGGLDLKLFRLKDDKLLIYLNECDSAATCEALMNRLPDAMKASRPSVRTLARLKTTVRKLALVTPDQTG